MRMSKKLPSGIFPRAVFCLLLSGFFLAAPISFSATQNSPELQQSFIEASALPAIRAIVASLQSQNAPVPPELLELVALEDDADAFYALAEKIFGRGWQERISRDATALRGTKETIMVRARMFLSSLAANSDEIARTSPLTASEIRTKAQNLIRESQAIRTDDARKMFFENFGAAYAAIFPESLAPSFEQFREDGATLLADALDAIGILAEGREKENLQKKLADVRTRLPKVTGSQELTAWLAEFDVFMKEFFVFAVPADSTTILKDLHLLLTNLQSSLRSIGGEDSSTVDLAERTDDLLARGAAPMTDAETDAFFSDAETLLMDISSP